MAGLDVNEYLTTTDETVRSRMHAIARAATAIRREEAEQLAVHIANNVGKMLGG